MQQLWIDFLTLFWKTRGFLGLLFSTASSFRQTDCV